MTHADISAHNLFFKQKGHDIGTVQFINFGNEKLVKKAELMQRNNYDEIAATKAFIIAFYAGKVLYTIYQHMKQTHDT